MHLWVEKVVYTDREGQGIKGLGECKPYTPTENTERETGWFPNDGLKDSPNRQIFRVHKDLAENH